MHVAALLVCAFSCTGAVRFPEGETAGWARSITGDVYRQVTFTLSVRQRNLQELKRVALAVSTPGDAAYGKYLSQRQIDDLTAPDPADVGVVTTWLSGAGIAFMVDRERVVATASVEAAQRLLSTTFYDYRAAGTEVLVRASAYDLPDTVAAVTAATVGLHGLPLPRNARMVSSSYSAASAGGAPPFVLVTPKVIAETYNMQGATVNRKSGNRQAVAEFQGQYMDKSDLKLFFKEEVPTAAAGDDEVDKFVGVPYKDGAGVEAALDIQFLMGVAPGVKSEFWEWASNDFCGMCACMPLART